MSTEPKPRPPTSTLTHCLLDSLRDLQVELNECKLKDMNLLESYDYFIRNSERGRACTYAIRARSMFMKMGYYQKLKPLVERLQGIIQEIEAGNE